MYWVLIVATAMTMATARSDKAQLFGDPDGDPMP
jgi:hypothetical protein